MKESTQDIKHFSGIIAICFIMFMIGIYPNVSTEGAVLLGLMYMIPISVFVICIIEKIRDGK